MTPRSSSLGLRALLALGLMIGFYGLAIAVAIVLVWLPYAEITYVHRVHPKLALGCLAGAAIILWSIMPRRDRFQVPGPRLLPANHPKLFAMIRGVASATKQAPPDEVYLVSDVNAWVGQRGGIAGAGGHRVMGLGLPLLQTLTVSELRAVLAHEFGHYHGGDTRLGRFVYQTRAAIGRTLGNLGAHGSILQLPFLWYGRLFLRVSHAVSRRQELAADRLAAEVAGAHPLASGLKKIHAVAPAFGYYWSNEVVPVLRAGFVPPLGAGFERFASGEIGRKALTAAREESTVEAGDAFDTHPPLRERLRALDGLTPGAVPPDDPLAVMLLTDPQALEPALIAALTPPDAKRMAPIAWSEVGERVYQPRWQAEVAACSAHVGALTVGSLAGRAGALSETLGSGLLPDGAAAPSELRGLRGNFALGAALAVALSRAGWATEAPPGEPVRLVGATGSLDPFATVQALVKGEVAPEAWAERCGRLGIADIEMLAAAPPPAPSRAAVPARAPEATGAPAPVLAPGPAVAVSDARPRTIRCWRCKEPVELPAESGGERPRCGQCGTAQWVPA
jgi:Zn-dependent protease with chaperone function